MVWFQCESCGDNLKKPKLQSHFQQCAAHRLSCIDCGVMFDRQSVQGHTSCVTEEVRYGPRDAFRQALANPSNGSKEAPAKPEDNLELTIGLSTRPPWDCSLCRVKCTSQETLQGHAQGKKHRAKARAAAKAQTEKEGAAVKGKSETEQDVANKGGTVQQLPVVGAKKEPESEDVGAASNGGAEGERVGKKKRKDREDVKPAETADVRDTKNGKRPKNEAAGGEQQTVEEKPKKEKKKLKKQTAETRSDGVDPDTGGATTSGKGTSTADTAEKKKGKKRKNKGDDVAGAAEEEGRPASDANAGPEAKPKKGRAAKALDGKQYWEQLAATGRRKKQEESPGGGEKDEGTVANGEMAQPAQGEAPQKKQRKGALENEAMDAGEVVKPSKLRKMMQAALSEAPNHNMSVKKLVQSVVSQPGWKEAVAQDALRQQILLESATSSKFRIEGGKVSLDES